MIFNPLFLTDNGSTQILAPKSNKLSNNKYLFSDIVKVVMSPMSEQKNLNNSGIGIIGSGLGLSLGDENSMANLKLKLISDIDNEKATLGLAEILPDEIAQLIIKENVDLSGDKAISYVSQEPLKGELQNFINDLVGKDLVENSLGSNSGLLISLEDNKSTVNLELVKESSVKTSNDKIIVQTLVIPEKSKLIPLFNNTQSNPGSRGLFNLGEVSAGSIGQKMNVDSPSEQLTKPILSVYSFNYGGDSLEELTQAMNANQKGSLKLSLVKGADPQLISQENQKSELEKISVIPGKLNSEHSDSDKVKNKLLSSNHGNLKILKKQISESQSDFNVNKITILKKQGDKLSDGSKILDESKLKRIDFIKQTDSVKAKIKFLDNTKELRNIKYNTLSSNGELSRTPKVETLKVNHEFETPKDEPVKKVNSNPQLTEKQQTHKENQIDIKQNSEQKKLLNVTQDSSLKHINSENQESKKGTLTNNKISSKNSVEQVENSTKTNNEAEGVKSKELDIKSEIHSKPKENIWRHDTKPNESSTKIRNEGADKTEVLKPKNENDSQLNNAGVKGKYIADNGFEQKIISNKDQKSTHENMKSDELQKDETLLRKEMVTENNGVPNEQNKENKKISVKVKNGIKNVSDKTESNNNLSSEHSLSQNNTSNGNSEFEQSSANTQKGNLSFNNSYEVKNNFENTLNQTISKEDLASINNKTDKAAEIEQNSNQKIVKSVEVIKEISRFISKHEKGTLSFDIKPEQLGKMKITLDSADHVIRARIDVDNEHARQLIERNLDKLYQELSENGIELSSLNISLGNPKQQKEENEIGKNKQGFKNNNGQVGETEEDEQKKSLGYNTYEYIA